ncbi:MAG: LacI family DNA-binding transcriptional regulator [Thermomicrobiales bacterium]|nr:LacI family DNA-binding transcriptional regulator [Thermomicrobiales bacterium]
MAMSGATIKDIARRAGVSTATVSYVINDSRFVSAELRERVTTAIRDLGYTPNANARSLRRQRTRTIGLICPDNANPFFAEIAKGVEDAGFAAGYSVVFCNSNASLERELAYLDLLLSKRVDGVILIATTAHTDHLRPVLAAGIPTVLFYRDPGDLDVDVIGIDNESAGYVATNHLLDLGHRAIACIQPASETTPSSLRVAGYRRALAERGHAADPALMPRGNNRISGGETTALALLAQHPSFTAILACNDAMAIGAMRAVRTGGFCIPEDVSVVGIDDILMASYAEPPLTTVAQPKDDAGRAAVGLLLDRLEGRHAGGARRLTLATELTVRGTSAPVRGSV